MWVWVEVEAEASSRNAATCKEVLHVLSGALVGSLLAGDSVNDGTRRLATLARRAVGAEVALGSEAIGVTLRPLGDDAAAGGGGDVGQVGLASFGLSAEVTSIDVSGVGGVDSGGASVTTTLYARNVHSRAAVLAANDATSTNGRRRRLSEGAVVAIVDDEEEAAVLAGEYGVAALQLRAALPAAMLAPEREHANGTASADGGWSVNLASGVASVSLVADDAATASALVAATADAIGGFVADADSAASSLRLIDVSVAVRLKARLPAAGGGACSDHAECFGGYCCNGECTCSGAYVGAHCEFEASCGVWSDVALRWNATCCTTHIDLDSGETESSDSSSSNGSALAALNGMASEVACACTQSGDVAVALRWEQLWLPQTGLAEADHTSLLAYVDDAGLGWLLLSLSVLALLAAFAALLDQRTLSVRRPPGWMSDHTDTGQQRDYHLFVRRVAFHMRLRHPLLRVVYCVPGHVPATRLQLTCLLFAQLGVSLCSCILWYGRPQCFVTQAAAAALVSALSGFVGSTCARWAMRKTYSAVAWGRPAKVAWRSLKRGSVQYDVEAGLAEMKHLMAEAAHLPHGLHLPTPRSPLTWRWSSHSPRRNSPRTPSSRRTTLSGKRIPLPPGAAPAADAAAAADATDAASSPPTYDSTTATASATTAATTTTPRGLDHLPSVSPREERRPLRGLLRKLPGLRRFSVEMDSSRAVLASSLVPVAVTIATPATPRSPPQGLPPRPAGPKPPAGPRPPQPPPPTPPPSPPSKHAPATEATAVAMEPEQLPPAPPLSMSELVLSTASLASTSTSASVSTAAAQSKPSGPLKPLRVDMENLFITAEHGLALRLYRWRQPAVVHPPPNSPSGPGAPTAPAAPIEPKGGGSDGGGDASSSSDTVSSKEDRRVKTVPIAKLVQRWEWESIHNWREVGCGHLQPIALVDASALPPATRNALDSAEWSFEGGGSLARCEPPRGKLLLAWALCVGVLLGCAAFCGYAQLVQAQLKAEDDGFSLHDYRAGVVQAYLLSLLLALGVKDPVQAALVAALPMASRKSRRPVKAAASLLVWLLTL